MDPINGEGLQSSSASWVILPTRHDGTKNTQSKPMVIVSLYSVIKQPTLHSRKVQKPTLTVLLGLLEVIVYHQNPEDCAATPVDIARMVFDGYNLQTFNACEELFSNHDGPLTKHLLGPLIDALLYAAKPGEAVSVNLQTRSPKAQLARLRVSQAI
jgi:hypothetical protein